MDLSLLNYSAYSVLSVLLCCWFGEGHPACKSICFIQNSLE